MRQHNDCLVLNGDYSPIGIIDWRKAMIWSYRYANSQYANIEIVEYYVDDHVISIHGKKNIPAVIKTQKYFRTHSHKVNFSRKNLFIRDNYTCQYCGYKPPFNQLTYDHVIPRSKWNNPNKSATSLSSMLSASTPAALPAISTTCTPTSLSELP